MQKQCNWYQSIACLTTSVVVVKCTLNSFEEQRTSKATAVDNGSSCSTAALSKQIQIEFNDQFSDDPTATLRRQSGSKSQNQNELTVSIHSPQPPLFPLQYDRC